MNKAKETDDAVELDLTDLIADDLPPELRASYYREMRHCQSLPKNDEVLRIIRVIQIHCQFAVKIPGEIAIEREKIEQAFASALKNLQENLQTSKAYQEQLDRHLINLPNRIAEDINPATIVAKINESLKQEFFRSTIPQTGDALRLVSQQMKTSTDEFVNTTKELTHSYRGLTENANQAIERMRGSISGAASAASEASQELSRSFRRHYRWALYALSGLALLVGIGIGMFLQNWIEDPPVQKHYIYQRNEPELIPRRQP
jgi:hypothetical protein